MGWISGLGNNIKHCILNIILIVIALSIAYLA